MSEDVQGQVEEQGQGQNASTNDYETIVAKVREEITNEVKSEMAGLHRKIGELTKEKEETAKAAEEEAKAKLSLSDRLTMMEEELKASRLKAEQEAFKSVMTKKAITELETAGLPTSVIDKIDVSSDETIAQGVAFFSELLSGYEKTAKDELRQKHAFKPGSGEAKTSVPKSLSECKTKEDKIAYLRAQRA